ncbi:MAG: filamentous hemagglutinin N-terminal domain-containing protein [Rhodospirillales bacterium]|nr:filamentous hemagglutinin N-terminal domain-containing protein [Rhodospirillales bacterium]
MKTGENKIALGEKGLKLGQVALMAALLSSSAFVPLSYANPEGGQVVGGSATISESGKKLDVHQHTDRTVIDWRSFNIDVDEHTEFHQPSSSATALNRVKSADPSHILGKLSANGNIVLVNPNGVFFGRDSVVDVNGLVATTADVDTDAFMGGSNHFDRPGKPDAAIVNEGTITAKDAGLVGLVAPNVENHGIIKAKMGRVQLASGDTVVADFYGDGLLKVEVTDDNVKSQFVGNTGKLEAEGGTVAMTAAAARHTVNSLIVAKGELKAPSVSKRGGKIIIGAGGSNKTDKGGASGVIVQASLDASGRNEGEQGGAIEVLGDHIAILDGTVMDASGHASLRANEESAAIQSDSALDRHGSDNPRDDDGGTATLTEDKQVRSEEEFMADTRRAGGSIKIGGDYLGGGDTQTAKTLYVGESTLTLNNAIDNGDAGRTIFWSDDTTEFNGLVLAMGGENGGNGGFLETSGKINLLANGFADLSNRADGYAKGTYLLDPQTITIYGNVDPTFVSTDASIDLTTNLELWLDAADETSVTLTYSTDSLGGATASGTMGTNTITTNLDVSAALEIGARISGGNSGKARPIPPTRSAFTPTPLPESTEQQPSWSRLGNLTATAYAGDNLYRGLVSHWLDKAAANHASRADEEECRFGFLLRVAVNWDLTTEQIHI